MPQNPIEICGHLCSDLGLRHFDRNLVLFRNVGINITIKKAVMHALVCQCLAWKDDGLVGRRLPELLVL